MMLPKLQIIGTVPIVVSVSNGINEGGAPVEAILFSGTCFLDEKARTVRGKDGIMVTLSGLAIIDGDIAPSIEKISGSVTIGNSINHYKINNCRRIRDMTGLVHHTELELL